MYVCVCVCVCVCVRVRARVCYDRLVKKFDEEICLTSRKVIETTKPIVS